MAVNANSINNNLVNKMNQQVYLGYSSILGNGNSSTLIAELENDVIIRLNSTTGFVDFYIDYEMNCYGPADFGIITLTIFLNDENISNNFVQVGPLSDNENGSLIVSDVAVERGDALTFRINVVYTNVLPPYTNSTSATGFGVVNKNNMITNNLFQDLIKNSPEALKNLLIRFFY
jgi:hypothetical protein